MISCYRHNESENDADPSLHNRAHNMLTSSQSAENLQRELMKCSSDGLSDKEVRIKHMKLQVKQSSGSVLTVGSSSALIVDSSSVLTVGSSSVLMVDLSRGSLDGRLKQRDGGRLK